MYVYRIMYFLKELRINIILIIIMVKIVVKIWDVNKILNLYFNICIF